MAYILAICSTGSVSHDFDPPIDIRLKAKMTLGIELAESEMQAVSRVVRISKPKRGVAPAIIGWLAGPFIVCEKIKEKLESLEPNVHIFTPIQVLGMEQSERDKCYGTYYWIHSPPRLDAIVIDETNFAKGLGIEGYELSGGQVSVASDGICTLKEDVVAGHHFWRLPVDFGVQKEKSRRGVECLFLLQRVA